ncbi:9984_t:CDS:2 [Acaulospora colombiana]|uniref:9984_t:CDS:1 n=1 Tax=Acaulospora colombiana TaxID=27376 RepID=A0ACA9LAR9_9GLOM|nr:9984_t:CDS:2 [Acaulospora colombiana]
MSNNYKLADGAANSFGGNDNNDADEVNTLLSSAGKQVTLIGGHGLEPTSSLSPFDIQVQEWVEVLLENENTASSSQSKEYGRLNPLTKSTCIPPNDFIIFTENYLRSSNNNTLTEQLSKEISAEWNNRPQAEKDYYHTLAVEIEKSYSERLLLQQRSEQLLPQPRRQSSNGFTFASPIDPRPNNAFLVDIHQDFCLFHSELNAPPTPTSIPNSPSAGPLMPVFDSFDLNDEDTMDSTIVANDGYDYPFVFFRMFA